MAIRKIIARSIEDSAISATDIAAGSITTAKIADANVTTAKIASSVTLTTPTIDTITSAAATALTLKSAGTTAITVSTGQLVGIGVTNPGAKLQVGDATPSTSNGIIFGKYATSTETNLPAIRQGSGDGAANDLVLGATSTSGTIRLFTGGANSSLDFGTASNAERVRIDSSGILLIGATVASNGYGNNSTGITIRTTGAASVFSNASSDYGLVLNKTTYQSGSTCYQVNFRTLNTNVGGIFSDNSSVTYATTSDHRLKENVQRINNAIDTVQQLNPVTYTWKADGSNGLGFIAHELQAVIPQAVVGVKDAVDTKGDPVYQAIDTSFLVATLAAAIQELKTENDALKARLDAAGL